MWLSIMWPAVERLEEAYLDQLAREQKR